MEKYIARNHNDTDLMAQPGSKEEAIKEAQAYMDATGNIAYVHVVDVPELDKSLEPVEATPTLDELYPWRATLLWSVIASMKLGIINDVQAGILPPVIKSFSDLHNYVDANEYGGFCIEEFAEPLIQLFGGRDKDDGMPDAYLAFMNEAQGIIDAWIRGANEVARESGPKLIIVN